MTDLSKDVLWYTAGPMSGYPQFNYPLFERAAAYLRGLGLNVVSPAEMDSAKMRALAYGSKDGNLAQMEKDSGETWADVLARDVKLIGDKIGGIVLLPKWYESPGARLETFVGLLQLKKRPFQFGIYQEFADDVMPGTWSEVLQVSPDYVRQFIRENMP